MKRRRFLLLAGTSTIAWGTIAWGTIAWGAMAAATKVPRIGFIHTGSRQANQSALDAFRAKLAALGWTDGSDIAVLDLWAEDRTEALPAIVKELLGSGVA